MRNKLQNNSLRPQCIDTSCIGFEVEFWNRAWHPIGCTPRSQTPMRERTAIRQSRHVRFPAVTDGGLGGASEPTGVLRRANCGSPMWMTSLAWAGRPSVVNGPMAEYEHRSP